MAIHIADPETDAMARELARRRNTTLTEIVRISVVDALRRIKCDRARASQKARSKFRLSKSRS